VSGSRFDADRRTRSGVRRLAALGAAAIVIAWPAARVERAAGSSVAERASEPEPRRHVVEIEGFAFRPASLSVAPGDTVGWINRDIVPHTATDSAGTWDSGALGAGASWSLVAAAEGERSYLCTLHPSMKGRLLVRRPRP
jgi:plastocyanin